MPLYYHLDIFKVWVSLCWEVPGLTRNLLMGDAIICFPAEMLIVCLVCCASIIPVHTILVKLDLIQVWVNTCWVRGSLASRWYKWLLMKTIASLLVACQILQRTLLLSSALVHGAFRISSSGGRSVSWLALVLEETTMVLSIFNRSYGNGQEIFWTIHSDLIKLIRMINLESLEHLISQ
jgi:hypothetical protein